MYQHSPVKLLFYSARFNFGSRMVVAPSLLTPAFSHIWVRHFATMMAAACSSALLSESKDRAVPLGTSCGLFTQGRVWIIIVYICK